MNKNNKEVDLCPDQPPKKSETTNIIAQEIDPFYEDLQKESQTIALQKTPPFPYKLLPEPLGRFINNTSKALSCPPDFVGLGVLVCASVAIGNGAVLELKNSWRTGASLYCGIVAEPGSAKTPAIKKALQPLFEMQERNYEEYQTKKIQFELEETNYEVETEKWKQQIKDKRVLDNNDKPEKPNPPIFEQIISMDSTMESLQEILLFNKRGVIKFHDELVGFIKGMNQYRAGAGADRQYWLSIWSNEPIIVNRKGKEPLQILKPFVSILGGIQPEMIDEILKVGQGGIANDGFIDRFLFSYPDSIPSNWTDEDVTEEVASGYREIIFDLYYALNEEHPKVVKLSSEAKEVFTTWYDVTENETLAPGFPETLKGLWKKIKGLHPRILLILHMLHWTSDKQASDIEVVDKELVMFTNYFMEYFKGQAKKVFQYTQSNNEDKNAIKLMDFVKRKGDAHEKGICIRVNALNQGKVFGRNTKIGIIEETIARIESQGLGEIEHLEYKKKYIKQFILYPNAIQD
ncbi:YfjI family protein [Robertmurraya korlensis]|uniref:YfjI family protein n=1 Tax=Robertmurraya korlensis TaxID=519977 RepID=UPI000B0131D2|nr:YfjI family protein [Robertmurraya korlensis]